MLELLLLFFQPGVQLFNSYTIMSCGKVSSNFTTKTSILLDACLRNMKRVNSEVQFNPHGSSSFKKKRTRSLQLSQEH